MPYNLYLADKAEKFLEKLFPEYKKTMKEHLVALQDNPYPRGCTPLEGRHDCYRIRIGHFRVQYVVLEKEKEIIVFKISRRDETIYK